MTDLKNEITVDLKKSLPLDRDLAFDIALRLNGLIRDQYRLQEENSGSPSSVCRTTAEIATLKFMAEYLVEGTAFRRNLLTKDWEFLAAEGYTALAKNGFRVPESAPVVNKGTAQ
ncbi:hypothetical protein J2X76_005425 [Neorhizobium sp. 2083]|uniref:hypothetical protein n=1 Tax=Neorhizobium sp. 2083 TaxID=2817762 RepID=UPI0028570AEF|nr:hypothetical protein [Neorhizobium sp. 2083]MDR6820228.1 hypothetical protein [Neorhizobium sp. 2083]